MSAPQNNQALIVVDMQNGLFHASQPPFEAGQLLQNINQLIDYAHLKQIPVFAIRHVGSDHTALASTSLLTQLIAELNIDHDLDHVLEKTRPNCFFQTDLEQQLKSLNIQEVIVCGLKTEFCIDSTCRAAKDLGLNVLLISDAHSTVDSAVLPAQKIIQHHAQTLNQAFVQLKTCAEFCT
ncbi:cysteine hydrolase family protein [Acinetobacter nematophilus]|uniref:Cysteine hydrolase family protein n=1 Tax=Acinetobacter nematophilus TaxID=2994642 RepID=A0A9X3IJB1_9GAMM|nr:cysteine hydrolase family protein [Acinetobacter nematophilus]MCX5469765.1 cysteine hydrolase family protein [Acinetobacter nematophilus]